LLGRWLAHVEQPTVIPPPPRPTDRIRRIKKLRRIAAAAVLAIAGVGAITLYELPSPFGRGAGGEGSGQEILQTPASPNPNPLPAGEGTGVGTLPARDGTGGNGLPVKSEIELLSDERPLAEACGNVGRRIVQIEQELSPSSPPADDAGVRLKTSELHRRLDDLGQRIDHNMP
jgi:hypothetical protein